MEISGLNVVIFAGQPAGQESLKMTLFDSQSSGQWPV